MALSAIPEGAARLKQFLFLLGCTTVGVAAGLRQGPSRASPSTTYSRCCYDDMWQWALPVLLSWSQYVAVAAILSTIALVVGLVPIAGGPAAPFRGISRVTRCYLLFGTWVCLTYFSAISASRSRFRG